MKHVSFCNEGLIDLRAIRVFGASSKETANPIGYFGTGLKYAIAVALRLGCQISIYRGLEKYTFMSSKVKIRVDEFDIVNMKDERTGEIFELAFTTELGKKWEAWQAFRELWCNAIDEAGDVTDFREKPREGFTTIHVDGEQIAHWYNKRETIMLMSKSKWMSEGIEIHHKKSQHAFYRRVRVADFQRPALLTYNCVGHSLDLTEDRTLKYDFLFHSKISQALMSSEDDVLLNEIIHAPKDTYEGGLSFSDCDPGPAVIALLEKADFKTIENESLHRMFKKTTNVERKPRGISLDQNEQTQMRRALAFLRSLGYDDIEHYPIIVTDELDDNCLGQARDGTIYLNRRTFMRGTKLVAGTIFEEWVHLHHALHDETRQLQDFFLDAMMTIGEKFVGEPL